MPGNWDLGTTPLSKPVVRELLEGKDYRDTSVFNNYSKAIQEKQFRYAKGIRSLEELEAYMRTKKLMIDEVSKGRFKTARENGRFVTDDVTVYVDRNGTLLLANAGAHRLVTAQLCQLGSIPVFLRLVHFDYWNLHFNGNIRMTLSSVITELQNR